MATSSNACSMHHIDPTTWKWKLDKSTTSDAPLNYLEDRTESTASGKRTRWSPEKLPCQADADNPVMVSPFLVNCRGRKQ